MTISYLSWPYHVVVDTHWKSYSHDDAYSQRLDEHPPNLLSKYIRALKFGAGDGRVLDIGCGVGQVVSTLRTEGVEAVGMDVAITSLARAASRAKGCWVRGKGSTLPFPAETFGAVGAFNVLEHLDEPEATLEEMVRVCRPGGEVVVSCPNFLRVIGFRDYHPRMRGVRQKLRNARAQFQRLGTLPNPHRFERMEPVHRVDGWQPDDDAIVVTSLLDIERALKRLGCTIRRSECTDRPVWRPLDVVLNATPLRYLMLNAFVVARTPQSQ